MVGSALGSSGVWSTLGFGIVNEVYYPRVDIPQIRDLGFRSCELKIHGGLTGRGRPARWPNRLITSKTR